MKGRRYTQDGKKMRVINEIIEEMEIQFLIVEMKKPQIETDYIALRHEFNKNFAKLIKDRLMNVDEDTINKISTLCQKGNATLYLMKYFSIIDNDNPNGSIQAQQRMHPKLFNALLKISDDDLGYIVQMLCEDQKYYNSLLTQLNIGSLLTLHDLLEDKQNIDKQSTSVQEVKISDINVPSTSRCHQ